ncbi:MAG: inositol monophosphatase [bacterium]|nr:inositol monophosphatase [bacterium]
MYLTEQHDDARALVRDTDECASLAFEACQLAGGVLMRYWQALNEADVREKSKGDLVTSADLEAERVVSEFLLREMPEAGIVCEEGTARAGNGLVWFLDPLDGTTNFVQRFPAFAVSLGLARLRDAAAPELLCGVVFNPLSGQLFWGAKDKGAFLGTQRLSVARKEKLSEAMLATGFPRRYHDELPAFLREFALIFPRCRAIRRAGSAALDLCWTAQGIFDGFWEHKLSPWDIAAGALIVQEAGGVCSDFMGDDAFLNSGNIVGAAPVIHQHILACIAEARQQG